MRGALTVTTGGQAQDGIIPADAGSTLSAVSCEIPAEDHPRGCGEHLRSFMPLVKMMGSSPRMRGAPKLL